MDMNFAHHAMGNESGFANSMPASKCGEFVAECDRTRVVLKCLAAAMRASNDGNSMRCAAISAF
jgi:hypothetical protein